VIIARNSYARITLALDIVRKIENGPGAGYHELNIIKHQINLHDILRIEETTETEIVCDNPDVPRDRTNICWQAIDLVRKSFNVRSSARIHIEKRIPVKGGLAGGSSNACTTLWLCNDLWHLGLTNDEISGLGRSLGMDVPYYTKGNTAFDTEATGVLEEISTSVGFWFVLVMPGFGVSTREAYGGIDYGRIGRERQKTADMRNAFAQNSREEVLSALHNDFELTVFERYPALKSLKQAIREAGCLAAEMSGSGSTLFGIAESEDQAQRIAGMIKDRTLVVSSLRNNRQ
jgi:4-diphosphocytidyl-2-C-methyl-D-erythritol kinase